MKRSIVLNILRIFFTVLWRLCFTAVILASLCVAAAVITLNMIFSGPSVTARDILTMTLLESEITAPIPAYFLGEDLVEHIRFGATTAVGTSDPEMILPGSCDADEWSAYPDGIRTETLVGETYTAQVLWLKDGSGSIEEYLRIVSAENNHCKYMGFRPDGTLLLSDEHTPLQELGATSISPCGAVLLLNGRANEALLAGESAYAPYTAIGQRADGTMVRITTNGWNKDAMGATYRDLINIFYEYDVVNACIIFSGEE